MVIPVTSNAALRVVVDVTPNVPPTVALLVTPKVPVIVAADVDGLNTNLSTPPAVLIDSDPPFIVTDEEDVNVLLNVIGLAKVEVALTVNVSAAKSPRVTFPFAFRAPVRVVVEVTPNVPDNVVLPVTPKVPPTEVLFPTKSFLAIATPPAVLIDAAASVEDAASVEFDCVITPLYD